MRAFHTLALLSVACGPGPASVVPQAPTQPATGGREDATAGSSGGSATGGTASELDTEARPEIVPDYNRDEWKHWTDADGDCQDTLQEVLIAESEIPVTFKTPKKCKVASGRWTCPYTGRVFTDPKKLDIDHVVPLKNAHISGGWRWAAAKKEAYANDLDEPEHLVAVDRGANRSKGSRGPEEWMPAQEDYWCQYVANWSAIKERWNLRMSETEAARVTSVLENCR